MSRFIFGAIACGSMFAVSSAAAAVRTPVAGGCFTITDRTECCLHSDGRDDPTFSGQECVPSKEGVFFDETYKVVCEPRCWADGTCNDKGSPELSSAEGTCAASVPPPPPGNGQGGAGRVAMAGGCFTITDRTECCLHSDGRANPTFSGQECVPSKEGAFFNPTYKVVCEPRCWAHGTCREHGSTEPSSAAGTCAASVQPPPPGTVEQAGAQIPVGGDLRFYTVASSNGAWQTWPDQLHAMLKDLGYNVNMPELGVPGAISRPSTSPVCQDAASWEGLVTPRFGMVGWSSWGFSYESTEDCDSDGYREIAGYNVSCINAWACNPQWTGSVPLVPITPMARAFRDAHVVLLANWINDGKSTESSSVRETCFQGADIDKMDSVKITETNLKKQIRAIHAENPNVIVLVLARYADTRMTIYVNERTLPQVKALNDAVKARLQDEPNTFFLDLDFPLNENIFQSLSKVHPNCRGDKVMATDVINKLYELKVLSRGLDLAASDNCLGSSDCANLDVPCCQRSALCYVVNGTTCSPYGPGIQ